MGEFELPVSEKQWNHDTPTMVSVVIAAFNHAKYIGQALESILVQQCNFKVEILINEDASKDDTAEILKQYEAKYPNVFRIVYQKENVYSKGIKPWCHILFPMARGKYIAICDGDDFWDDPAKLKKQVDYLEANAGDVVTYHDARTIDADGNPLEASVLPEDRKRDFTSDEIMTGVFLLPVTMCFRNVLHDFPPEIGTVANGDTFIISMLGQYGGGKYLNSITPSVYRVHQGGVWGLRDNLRRKLAQRHTALQLMRFHSRQGNTDAAAFFNKRYLQITGTFFSDLLAEKKYREFFKNYSHFIGTPTAWKHPANAFRVHKTAVKLLFKAFVTK
jgi:glycosyltransferase involved in cell wall biosynthesis